MAIRLVPSLVTLLLVPAAASFAQAPSAPPPIFGVGGRGTLTATTMTYGGFDDATVHNVAGERETQRESIGQYGGLTASMTYARPVSRFAVSANGSSDLRYYAQNGGIAGIGAQNTSASLTLGRTVGRYTQFRLSQVFDAASFYRFDPFSSVGIRGPEDLILPEADARLERGRTYSYDLAASNDFRVGRYSTFSLDYRYRQVRFPTELVDLRIHGGGLRFVRRVTQHLSATAGYGLDYSEQHEINSSRVHRLDLGLSYDATLPFSPRTRVSFSSGSAVSSLRDEALERTYNVPQVTFSASVQHQMTRTWWASADYRREPRFVELYRNPTYGDVAAGSIRGNVSRRVRLGFSAGYSGQRLDAGRSRSNSRVAFGSVRTDVIATRLLSLYGEYAYYGFDVATEATILRLSEIRRQAVRTGLTLRLPLVRPRS